MFQIKSFVSITASMVNRMRTLQTRITDYNIGGKARTMLEAVSQEIDELYREMVIALEEAIPVAIYNAFGFTAIGAQVATGLIRVTIAAQASDVTITAGSTIAPNAAQGGGVAFVATADATITAGATYVDVPVAATVAGIVGNLPANTAFTPMPIPAGFVSAANLSDFRNGQPAETPSQRKARFGSYITTIARGIVAALSYACSKAVLFDAFGNVTERVLLSYIDEWYERDNTLPTGQVTAYIHNGTGGTSGDLVARAQQIITGYKDALGTRIPGYKAAGVHVAAVAASESAIAVTGVLTPKAGYESQAAALIAAAKAAIATYINATMIGLDDDSTVELSQLYTVVQSIPGVGNWHISTPTGDITATLGQKLMAGTLTVTTP